MKRCLVVSWLLLCASVSNSPGQNVRRAGTDDAARTERKWISDRQMADLFARASASELVAVGSVVKDEPITARKALSSLDENLAGDLYTITLESTLCRQTDFHLTSSATPARLAQAPQSILVFVPLRPFFVEDKQSKEQLHPGHRYLLFLVPADREQQGDWTKEFGLDPEHTYYRGQHLARGVVPLATPTTEQPHPEQPEVLNKVERLCDAASRISGKGFPVAKLGAFWRSGSGKRSTNRA